MQCEISAAACLHEKLRTAVLVDESRPYDGFLRLCHQKVKQHGLAGARGINNQRMTQIALMEIEKIGAARTGLEKRNGFVPMIAARLAGGESMKGRKGGEIERCDRRRPGAPREI